MDIDRAILKALLNGIVVFLFRGTEHCNLGIIVKYHNKLVYESPLLRTTLHL